MEVAVPCYCPLSGWLTNDRHPTGGRIISFGRHSEEDKAIDLPCGRCVGCRLERSRQWAVRLLHELQDHACASFLTLTYSPEKLPPGGTLVLKHTQDFLKRLRVWQARSFCGPRLRFFLAGEYGELNGRPHYHLILFGQDFLFDRTVVDESVQGFPLYESETLSSLWGFGRAVVGDVTFESAAYVARYTLKKVTGVAAEEHYKGRKPEFATMSRRPGIGARWIERWRDDVYPSDEVIVRGRPSKPPRAYDRWLQKFSEDEYTNLKEQRELALQDPKVADRLYFDSSTTRLLVKQKVKLAQIRSLKRSV